MQGMGMIYGIGMPEPVFYRSVDGGHNWEVLNTEGLPEDLSAIFP